MRNLKRLGAMALMLVLAFSLAVLVFAAVDDTGFSDVDAGAWYAEAVVYCREHDLMAGTGENRFDPESDLTRAQLATVLYRIEGTPAVTGKDAFTDTPDGAWYSDAVLWASQRNLMGGYGGGQFGPNDPVSREQMTTILWRYAGSPGADGASDYTDETSIAAYAAAAVDWSGVNNKPTTLAGYGITDAVSSSMVSDTAVAGKLLKLDADGKLPASITGDAATLETHPASYFATAAALTTLDTAYQATKTKVDELAAAVLGEGSDTGDKGTLIERMDAVETQIGAADTEGSILYSIAQLQAGTSIQALSATKITGKLTRAQLPDDVGGTVHAVADLATAYATLTAENTHLGDWVKLADGKLYMVTNIEALNAEDGYTLMLDVTSFDIAWAKITGKPDTLAGYGITDAVNVSDVIVDGMAESADVGGKIVKINSTDKKLHVNIAGDAATVGGHAPEYFATQAALEALSLQVPQMLNSVDELTNPKVGQMVMIPITASTGG